jgi:hypothetical protein
VSTRHDQLGIVQSELLVLVLRRGMMPREQGDGA